MLSFFDSAWQFLEALPARRGCPFCLILWAKHKNLVTSIPLFWGGTLLALSSLLPTRSAGWAQKRSIPMCNLRRDKLGSFIW